MSDHPEPSMVRRKDLATDRFIENPSANDILFGRGAAIIRWKGNVRFRQLVNERKHEYIATRSHAQKNEIARQIIQEIHTNWNGRFLVKVTPKSNMGYCDSSRWEIADEMLALEKVKQTLRDRHSSHDPSCGRVRQPPARIDQTFQPPTVASSACGRLEGRPAMFHHSDGNNSHCPAVDAVIQLCRRPEDVDRAASSPLPVVPGPPDQKQDFAILEQQYLRLAQEHDRAQDQWRQRIGNLAEPALSVVDGTFKTEMSAWPRTWDTATTMIGQHFAVPNQKSLYQEPLQRLHCDPFLPSEICTHNMLWRNIQLQKMTASMEKERLLQQMIAAQQQQQQQQFAVAPPAMIRPEIFFASRVCGSETGNDYFRSSNDDEMIQLPGGGMKSIPLRHLQEQQNHRLQQQQQHGNHAPLTRGEESIMTRRGIERNAVEQEGLAVAGLSAAQTLLANTAVRRMVESASLPGWPEQVKRADCCTDDAGLPNISSRQATTTSLHTNSSTIALRDNPKRQLEQATYSELYSPCDKVPAVASRRHRRTRLRY